MWHKHTVSVYSAFKKNKQYFERSNDVYLTMFVNSKVLAAACMHRESDLLPYTLINISPGILACLPPGRTNVHRSSYLLTCVFILTFVGEFCSTFQRSVVE